MTERQVYMDAVEAQRITIHMLSALTPDANIGIYKELTHNREKLSADELRFLELCLAIGGELRTDPERYHNVETVCMTILRRQKGKGKILKKECGEALGLGKMGWHRLKNGERTLSLDQITAICAGFNDPITQRFWENQLLELYPDTSAIRRRATFEMGGLRWLHKITIGKPYLYSSVLEQLDELDKKWLTDLFESEMAFDQNCFGDEPDKLYSVIGFLSQEKTIPIFQVIEKMAVSNETWYGWRHKWEKAEKCGFQQGVPKNKLSHAQVLILCVLFELDHLTSIYLMALAGYRFRSKEPDTEVLKYLRGIPGAKPSCGLMDYLHEGIYLGRW